MTSELNQGLFERDALTYATLELQRPEQSLLGRFRERWPEVRMLDLGIGTGRTSFTFAPLVAEYVGIDYAPRMVELARELVPESDTVRLLEGDARRLGELVDGPFDLILFSFNGIDYVDHEDRLSVLAQVRELLAERGLFCFSSHSIAALPLPGPRLNVDARRPLHTAYRGARALQALRKVRRANSRIDVDELRKSGRGVVVDGAHGFEARTYYVTPAEQLRQLAEAGFGEVEVQDLGGRPVDPARPGRDPWLYYFCS